ncbi:hypothetical protein [Mycobacterium sp. 1274756.6]|uniref:hypothetical protein n=1 Tax=Mycobacterium sp. 1274756.6 TaxID=1834076 RepID=UPI0007FE9807|nr:hypothetical protein [Mycobacterium sp. 1274756.6]OBJ71987.1 hypothetical protein A5643_00725 [Mycobacterium sp. 1274756.6]
MTSEDSERRDSDEAPASASAEEAATPEESPARAATGQPAPHSGRQVRLTVSLRGLAIGSIIAVLVVAVAVLAWLYRSAQEKVDEQTERTQNYARAEQVSLDYAVEAAAMDFADLDSWKSKLVAGTSPELNKRLSKAAVDMEQILVPLEWTSTAQPLVAKVRSETDGVYVVDCFVSVLTTTVQADGPLQSTATYSVTLDSADNWQITDVGGIGAVVGER